MGFGHKVAGHAGKALGNITGNKNMQKGGQESINKSQAMGYDAKYNAYLNNIIKSVVTDLSKLNIQIKNPIQLSTDIKQSIVKNTQGSSQHAAPVQKKHAAPVQKKQTAPVQKKPAPAAVAPTPAPVKPVVAPAPKASVTTQPQGKNLGRKGYSNITGGDVNYRNPTQPVSVKKNNTALAANAPVKSTTIPEPKKQPAIKSKVVAQPPMNNMTYAPTKQAQPVAHQPMTYNYGKLTKPKYNHNTTFQGKDVSK